MKIYNSILVPVPTRIKLSFLKHMGENAHRLDAQQMAAFERFSENDSILEYMNDKFFDGWIDQDRRQTLEEFMRHVCEDIENVYEGGDEDADSNSQNF